MRSALGFFLGFFGVVVLVWVGSLLTAASPEKIDHLDSGGTLKRAIHHANRSSSSTVMIRKSRGDLKKGESSDLLNATPIFVPYFNLPITFQHQLRQVYSSHEKQHGFCGKVLAHHNDAYEKAASAINFNAPPPYKMPWYYADPSPLCGQLLLHRLTGGPRWVFAVASETNFPIVVELGREIRVKLTQCGSERALSRDILLMARAVGDNAILSGTVTVASNGIDREVVLEAAELGLFSLEIRVVHVNGTSDDPADPMSLGVIGIRAVEHRNRKAFRYNYGCDVHRHIYGSPWAVRVVRPEGGVKKTAAKPLCTTVNHTKGRWVRFTNDGFCSSRAESIHCLGDPKWLSDAAGYNKDMVWSPDSCRYRIYSPPIGPPHSCVSRRGVLLIVGDSVMREYGMNCGLFDLRPAKLMCQFNNIALEGQHYSADYARSVVKVIVDNVLAAFAVALATNLGIHHMIGPCSTAQWSEYVQLFVSEWKARIKALKSNPQYSGPERLVWIGPPTIHYARKGMGFQRAEKWDRIAWNALQELGFVRLNAIAPTLARQEGSWDGLHNAAQRGKVQTVHRNKGESVKIYQWNGGIANMLFIMLLNVLCPAGSDV